MSSVKKITVAGSWLVACLGAWAQMPVPLLDGPAAQGGSRQSDPYAQAVQQMEELLMCKPATKIDARAVAARFEAFGLRRNADGIFQPPANAPRVPLFGDEVVAALVTEADGEKKISVYLGKQSGKQMAKRLGVSRIDEHADTDQPSYFKPTGKKTTLLVGAASELWSGNGQASIPYRSMVTCQLVR